MSATVSSAAVGTAVVLLRGGLAVPLDALQLAWSLEDRGGALLVEGNELVVDGTVGFLTDTDCAAIRRWREHLKAIASYRAPAILM